MTSYKSVSPDKAVEIVQGEGIDQATRIILDFAAAGLVKGYALMTETVHASNNRQLVRGAAVSVDLWRRIIQENLSQDVWRGGTLRLSGDLQAGSPEVNLTGLSFNETSLRRLIDHHGRGVQLASPIKTEEPIACVTVAEPIARQVAPPEAIPPGAVLVTVKQAMAALGLGRTKINALMNDGRLVKRKVDRSTLIEVESIRRLASPSKF